MVTIGYAMGAFRAVELDVDIGSSALDYAALQKSEVWGFPSIAHSSRN